MSETVFAPKKKHRDCCELSSLTNRLHRIEGQVRGVENMLLNDGYCTDILTQISAIQSALNAFNRELLSNHIKTCVTDGIKNGDEEIVDELLNTLQKIMK